MCIQCPQSPDKAVRSPGTRVSDGCELLCLCWEQNPGPLEEQPVVFTAGSSLQPPKGIFIKCNAYEEI